MSFFNIFHQSEICFHVFLLGTCSSYILIIKDQIHLLIQHHVGESYWLLDSRILTIGLTVIMIFPLSLQKDLDFLKYPSYLVILGIFYVVFDVLIRLVSVFLSIEVNKNRKNNLNVRWYATVKLVHLRINSYKLESILPGINSSYPTVSLESVS